MVRLNSHSELARLGGVRIAVVHPMPTWYRKSLFELLSTRLGAQVLLTEPLDLPVYGRAARQPKSVAGFKAFAPLVRVRAGSLVFKVNPGLVSALVNYDVIIWGDYVTTPNALVIPFLKMAGKRVVFWLDEWGWKKPLLRRMLDPYVRWVIKLGDAYVAHGARHASYLTKMGVPSSKIVISGNASRVPVASNMQSEAESIRAEFGNRTVMLYVGELARRKRPDWVLDALVHVRRLGCDLSLIMVGDGDMMKSIEENVQRQRLQGIVRLTGWVDHSKIAPYYRASDFFVFPAVDEPWGLVINEAQQFSLPVVVSDSVGASEVVEHGVNGFVFPSSQKASFLNYAARLAMNENLRHRMALSASAASDAMNFERMFQGFESALVLATR